MGPPVRLRHYRFRLYHRDRYDAAGATHAYLLTPVMQGDANEDGRVDVNDLTIVLTDFDRSVGANGWTLGDFNGAEKVDINDLTIVLASSGESLGPLAAGTATVPEPAAAVLAAGVLYWPAGLRQVQGACGGLPVRGAGRRPALIPLSAMSRLRRSSKSVCLID